MTPQRRIGIIPIMLAFGITLSLLFAMISVSTFAQTDPTPTAFVENWYLDSDAEWENTRFAEPGTSVGEANWVVADASFESNYPSGFTFRIKANSDMSDIVTASVIWSHTPNFLQREETSTIPSTGNIVIRYQVSDPTPPWVAVNYYWSFVDAKGNRYRTEWIVGQEYVPNDIENWVRVESEDVIIVAQDTLPQRAITQSIEAMETQRETFKRAWGGALSYKPRVILFDSRSDFNQWLGAFNTGILGITSEEWGATVQILDYDDITDLTYGTVPHEIGHLYQFDFVGEDGFPAGSWFTEGNATLFELTQMYDYEERVRNLARRGELPSLLDNSWRASFVGEDGIGRLGYDVGFTFWKWVVTRFGLEGHLAIVQELTKGVDRDEAIENALGMSLAEIEAEWALWLGADAPPPTPLPQPTVEMRFPATVTPFPQN